MKTTCGNYHYIVARALVTGLCFFMAAVSLCQPALSQSSSRELWVIPFQDQDKAAMVLAQTMQGLSGGRSPCIWLESGGMSARVLADLEHEGWRINRIHSVWDLPDQFWKEHPSFITYRLKDQSLNIATTLAGQYNAVAVAEELRDQALAKGLKEVFNAVGQDQLAVLRKFKQSLSASIAVDQDIDKAAFLRDYAVLNKAYCFSAGADDRLRMQVAAEFPPGMFFFGWGPEEYSWISDFSRYGSQGIGSDFCVNLSALSRLPVPIPAARLHNEPAPVREGERIVAFLLSDGDNLQWLNNNMAFDKKYFANPHRGEFKINWGLSPLLASLSPRVLKYFYDNASANDCFFAAGNPGYRYIHLEPAPRGVLDARQSQLLLRESHLRIVTTLNTNEGGLTECWPLLDLPEVDGVVYLSYAPYNRLRGQVFWRGAKPAVACKFMLWDNLAGCDIQAVARSIAAMPASPGGNIGSYAIVIVHAWSFEKLGGPIEAMRQTIARLPAGTRVVSLEDYFKLLKANFAKAASARTR